MMSKYVFFTARFCGICILLGALSGCATEPAPVQQTPPAPAKAAVVKEDVWTLLAKGEGNRARAYFLGQVDVNATDSRGRTPLHYAAENKDPVLAAFLVNRGAIVDALDGEYRTPLSISAEKLDAETAGILAGNGANIHCAMRGDTTPARIAVAGAENGEFLSALLNPVSLVSVDSTGKTLLHIAAEAGNAKAVDTILETGNNLAQKDYDGKTALDIALERTDSRDHAEAAEHLILAGAVSANPLYSYFAPAVRTSNYNIRGSGGMAPLHYTAREGYSGYLVFLLERRADVNIKNASGATPLHEAARSGNIKLMETLLDNRAEINTQDAKGNSVLHIAIPTAAHLAAVELFLDHGANPNLRDEHGDSPLHTAITLNRPVEVIEALLSGGADISIRDMNGKTPLYLAVEKDRSKYVPLLLSHKADIFAADNNGVTPYEKALLERTPVLFSLITEETVLQNDSAGNTILHITVTMGINGEILNAILNRRASIDARNKAGDTSLAIAVRLNRQSAGELLLGRGADIFAANARLESPLSLTFPPDSGRGELRQWMLTPQTLSVRDGLGNTALHYLAQWRFDTWIPPVIHMGANTEAPNATGETPLFTAVKQNSPSTIRALTANGALLDARDTLGNSALHAAVRWNAPLAAEALIDSGLDINCHALNGKTPLHDSIRLGMDGIEKLLVRRKANIEARDADGNTSFMEAVITGNPVIMEQLAEIGADTNTRNFRGDTALHIAAASGRVDIANLLLGWGASIHARNARGRTPYEDALITSPRMVRTLLTKERLYASDDNGSSPLHIAVKERTSTDMIKIIMEMGVRLNSVDFEGRTPLRVAVDLGLWESAKLLADSGGDVFTSARDGKTAAEIVLDKNEEAVTALFSGAAIGAKDSSGNTILHYAARKGKSATISTLLSLGALKNVKNIAAESPADIASRWNHPEAAALLN